VNTARLINIDHEETLSQRITCGCLRSATIASSTRVTLRLAKLVSTSKAKHSRVYASPRSAPGSLVHTPPHRAGNPAPTPDSPKSAPPAGPPFAHAMLALLPPDHQPCLPVYAMHPLVVHMLSRAAQQNMQPPIPEARLLPRQLHQPRSQRLIAAPALVAIARYRHRHQAARTPLAEGILPAHFSCSPQFPRTATSK
jgi:hypothetical protein